MSDGSPLSSREEDRHMGSASNPDLLFVPSTGGARVLNDNTGVLSHRHLLSPRRRARPVVSTRMNFMDPVHTFPEFINQIMVSCGLGLAGIVGAKATERARALTAGDRKAEHMDALAKEIDSLRRRRELAEVPSERDWSDVHVDRFASVTVVPEVVPELESSDDLEAFDKLLMDSPAAKRARLQGGNLKDIGSMPLPEPSEFEFLDDEAATGL